MNEQVKTKDPLDTMLKFDDEKRAVGKVISFTKTNAVPRGENHLSQVSRMAVETVSPTGKRTTRWLIWKELPEEPATRAYITKFQVFVKELTCYRDILTVYEDLIEEFGYPHEILWPKCVNMTPYSRIVLEDLKPLGYKMRNKFDGLDLDHCVLVMQALGSFHALSLLAIERHHLPLELFSNVFNFGNERGPYEFRDALMKLVPALMSWGADWGMAADQIRGLIPCAAEKLKASLARDDTSLYVFNHGDCWTNNFLFKYDLYSGKPLQVRLFDFQMSFYHTPGFDLTFFLALSPDKNVRRHHVDRLINVYHESLILNMNTLQVAATPPTLSAIRDEVNRLRLFKLFLILIFTPKMIGLDRTSEPFNIEKRFKEILEASESDERDEMPWLDFENEDFRSKIQMVLKEAMENDSFK